MNQIKISEKQGKVASPLSKEQKRFNNYINKIKKLKAEIEAQQILSDFLLQKGQELILPIEKQIEDVHIQVMLELENSPFSAKLTVNELNKLKKIILGYAETAVFTFGHVAHKALFDKYSSESFDEIQERQMQEQKKEIRQTFNMFGMDIADKDMETPEDLVRKLAETEEKMKEIEAEKAEKAAKRKKTKAQLEKQAREKQAAETVNKTTKQIYRDLVQNFHPDREQDDAKRQEKTAIMQKITAAYEADDFLKLLELQINLLDDRENAFGKFDDTQLKYFNNILKDQAMQLEHDAYMNNPRHNGHPFGHLAPYVANTNVALDLIKTHANRKADELSRLGNTLLKIQTFEGFKDYIKHYKIGADVELDADTLLNMLFSHFRN